MAAWSACQVLPARPPDQQQVRRQCLCMMSAWNGMWRADTSRTLSVQTAYGLSWLAYLHLGSPVCPELNAQRRYVSLVGVIPCTWAGWSACSIAILRMLLPINVQAYQPAEELCGFNLIMLQVFSNLLFPIAQLFHLCLLASIRSSESRAAFSCGVLQA